MIISTWNIRGLNQPLKQKELKLFLQKNKIELFGCLETRVRENKAQNILSKVSSGWSTMCNYPMAPNGRIWLFWKPYLQVQVLQVQEQFIHCKVDNMTDAFSAFVTIVYAKNEAQERLSLWSDLTQLGNNITGAWLLSGDFNTLLFTEDRMGSPVTDGETKDFRDCMDTLQLTALKAKGWHFTFCNKQQQGDRVYSKIYWALGNLMWLQSYGHVEADFLNPGASDHSPIYIEFKTHCNGTRLFQLWHKLKDLKIALRDLNTHMASYSQKSQQSRRSLDVIQSQLANLPMQQALIDKEKKLSGDIQKWSYIEEKWKIRSSRNSITSIYDTTGNKLTDPKLVEAEFISFFSNLMASMAEELPCPNSEIIKRGPCLSHQQKCTLIQTVTEMEIFNAVRDMPSDKAPGVDGYPVEFFTQNWDLVKHDVVQAVKEFFLSEWIMECISKVSYSLVIHGGLTKPFQGKRGIRQGDPMSPYLFVIAMEYLQRELNVLADNKQFQFHPRCKKLKVMHICFANDLLMFCKAELNSIKLLQEAFLRFSVVSGLQANTEKSSIYMSGVNDQLKQEILTHLGYCEGTLPFKYLGVPLSSKKLTMAECMPLVEKITDRVKC
ncbi:uncharacterized protein LOC132613540 [Lycium barbarum]|uniref:uncharacterized protein LOC132613540 n=1 Tax=Lycium barbarum TaxID=112863 RepID=UPI00293F4519|nr:uncharacterized protein LOC132613540 [Lycium barbarum]